VNRFIIRRVHIGGFSEKELTFLIVQKSKEAKIGLS